MSDEASNSIDERVIFKEMGIGIMGLLEEMPGGFFIYHADGDESLIYANDACLRIFGCETLDQFKELTGYTFPGMLHPEDVDEVEASIVRQIANDRHKMDYVEYRIITRDGTVRWIEDYGHYVTTPSGDYFYVFINDATERLTRRMHQLEQVNDELEGAYAREHENKEMLRAALQQANAANVAKTSFLNNMSHNIRTLLNAVSGYSHMILSDVEDAERVKGYSEHIVDASDQLLEVVAETLEVSRLEAGNTQLVEEECRIADVVARVTAVFESRAADEGKQLAVEVDDCDGSMVVTDVHCVNQVLTQLLDNSFKYTEQGDAIKLRVVQENDADKGYARLTFELSDTGIGMTPEFLERMYEPFERSGNTTETGIIGTGLGLTIVRHVIDMLSGSIDVKSEKDVGTTIVASITAKLVPGTACSPRTGQEGPTHRKILVVEDNDLNREIITSLLEDCGHVVTAVGNGQQAVDIIAASGPDDIDVVLMDIQMPVMNGYEAAAKIRGLSNPKLATIPIIAVTSDAFPEDRKRSFSCGMDAHISKPINVSALNATMDSLLS